MERAPTKILIADDSALMHKLIAALLPGTALVHALDGTEALSRLEEHPDVGLLIVDLDMPRLNGLELVRRLATAGVLARVPVVVMTTEGKEQDAIACLRAGAAAYLRKPFQHDELVDLVGQLLAPGG
jgi:two-component system, chemotaxis family, chemotaxis protein CheY